MNFRFWVVRGSGAPFALEVEAASIDAARDNLGAQGLVAIGDGETYTGSPLVWQRRPTAFDITLFTQEILALLTAGLTLVEGLRALAAQAEPNARGLISSVLQCLERGQSFATALAEQRIFPELYVALVRASEQTSDLPMALERYLAYANQMAQVRQRIVSAAIYPLLLTVTGMAAIIFLLTYVVPRFSGVYEGMHGDLPWTATLMMHWGQSVKAHGIETFAGVVLGLASIVGLTSAAPVRRTLARRLLSLPVLGEQMRLLYMARLYRTLGMLLEGGITLTRALQMSIGLLPGALRNPGEWLLKRLREGERPSIAFSESGLSTAIASQMLSVGERSGNLGLMMTRIAEFYENDTARKLERAMRVFEPILMAFIGLGIGVVVILMYLPIFELAGAIQ